VEEKRITGAIQKRGKGRGKEVDGADDYPASDRKGAPSIAGKEMLKRASFHQQQSGRKDIAWVTRKG